MTVHTDASRSIVGKFRSFIGYSFPSTHDRSFFDIDLVQQKPLIHPELRVTHDHLSLQLELDHRNRLVHFLIQHGVTHIVLILPVIQLKAGAGILVVVCSWQVWRAAPD